MLMHKTFFSNQAIGFYAGLGVAAWVYGKMKRRTGGNTQTSLIVAAISGIFAWLFLWSVLSLVPGLN